MRCIQFHFKLNYTSKGGLIIEMLTDLVGTQQAVNRCIAKSSLVIMWKMCR